MTELTPKPSVKLTDLIDDYRPFRDSAQEAPSWEGFKATLGATPLAGELREAAQWTQGRMTAVRHALGRVSLRPSLGPVGYTPRHRR